MPSIFASTDTPPNTPPPQLPFAGVPLLDDDVVFVLQRLPAALREVMVSNVSKPFLVGGFIRAVIAGEQPNDIDFVVGSPRDARMLAAAIEPDGKHRWHSDNAITMREGRKVPVQVIHRWTYATPTECLDSFDFTIACAAIWYDQDALKWCSLADPRFYADLASRRLVYRTPTRPEDAGGSMLRVLKFYGRGYRIPLPEFSKVLARLVAGVKTADEEVAAGLLLARLREVDPNTPFAEDYADQKGHTFLDTPNAAGLTRKF